MDASHPWLISVTYWVESLPAIGSRTDACVAFALAFPCGLFFSTHRTMFGMHSCNTDPHEAHGGQRGLARTPPAIVRRGHDMSLCRCCLQDRSTARSKLTPTAVEDAMTLKTKPHQ